MMGEMEAEPEIAVDGDGLVRRARTDGQALGQLYERHYDGVFRYCLHRLFVREVAADATSAVFLSVATHIRGFRGDTEADFRNWLFAISTHQCHDFVRTAKRRNRLLEAAVRAGQVRLAREDGLDAPSDGDWAWLYQAMARLKPRQQTLITMRFFEGLSYEQIAGILHRRPGTLRVMTARALDKLRKLLAKSHGGGDEPWTS